VRGEAAPPGLHGRAPARPRGCRARAQVGRTQQQGAGGEGERRCSGRSGVTGGEQQGEARWGGAPTMAQPAGNGGGASWWRSVEARAERGGPAASRPGGGSQTGGIGINRRCGNPARSRGSDGAAAWRTSCLLRSRAVVHRAATAQEERGPAQGRAHGGSRRGRGDEAADEIETPRQVGPSALLDHDGRGGSEGSTAHPTRALPRAEIDLPGAVQRRLRK